jgi:hypothetical protein
LRILQALFFLFLITDVIGQSESFELVGVLESSDKTQYIYKLDLKISGSAVEGYSITDFQGEFETKTSIKGKYDFKSGQLTFEETKLVYTKAKNISDFCFLQFDTKLSTKNKKTSLVGDAWGTFNKDTCFTGGVALIVSSYVNNRIEKVEKKINAAPIKDEKKEEIIVSTQKYKSGISTQFIRKDEEVTIHTSYDTCRIWVWDNGDVDGDKVTFKINGSTYLSSYNVTKQKKLVSFVFSQLKSSKLEMKNTNLRRF